MLPSPQGRLGVVYAKGAAGLELRKEGQLAGLLGEAFAGMSIS
jgi:hypothetical protein